MQKAITLQSGLPGIDRTKITIGIELEFLITNLPPTTEVYNELIGANSTFGLVRNALRPVCDALGIPRPGHGKHGQHETFLVKSDTSICVPGKRRGVPVRGSLLGTEGGVEVATPILPYDRYASVIRDTCGAIVKAADAVGARAECNQTTGLHVHIGLGRAYTLDEVKRIAKAVIIFEAAMDRRHPLHRNGEFDSHDGTNYIKSCRDSGKLRDLNTGLKVGMIAGAGSYLALCAIVNTGLAFGARRVDEMSNRYYKYNFEAVGTYGTIEFRQAAGTMDAAWIEDWVERVVQFVVAAVETEDEVFAEWARIEGGPADPAVLGRFGAGEVMEESLARKRRISRGRSRTKDLKSKPAVPKNNVEPTVTYPELPKPEPSTVPPKTVPAVASTPATVTYPELPDADPSPPVSPTSKKPVPDTTTTKHQLPDAGPSTVNPRRKETITKTTKTDVTYPALPDPGPSTIPRNPPTAAPKPNRALRKPKATAPSSKRPAPRPKTGAPTPPTPAVPNTPKVATTRDHDAQVRSYPSNRIALNPPTVLTPDPACGMPAIALVDPSEAPMTLTRNTDSNESLASETDDEELLEEEVYYVEPSIFSAEGAIAFPIIAAAMLPVALLMLWVRGL